MHGGGYKAPTLQQFLELRDHWQRMAFEWWRQQDRVLAQDAIIRRQVIRILELESEIDRLRGR